ncbi:unnamed protein product [Sphagnum balticum]
MLTFLHGFDSNIPLGFVNGVGDWKVQGSCYLFKAWFHILGLHFMFRWDFKSCVDIIVLWKLVKSLNGIGRLFLDNWNLFLVLNICGLDIFLMWLLSRRDIWLFKCWLFFVLSFNLRKNLGLPNWSINFGLLFLDDMLTVMQGFDSNIPLDFLNGVGDGKVQGSWYLFKARFHILGLHFKFRWDFKWCVDIIVLWKLVKFLNWIGHLFLDNWNLFLVLNRCGLDIFLMWLLSRRDIWLFKCWLFFVLSFNVTKNLGLRNWSINFGLLFLDDMLTSFQRFASNIPWVSSMGWVIGRSKDLGTSSKLS